MVRPSYALSVAVLCSLLLGVACGDDGTEDPGDVSRRDGGTAPRDGGDTSPLGCPELFECLAVCDEDDSACQDACYARATAEGAERALDLALCAAENGCLDEVCLAELCGAELLACADVPPPPLDGGVPELDGGVPELDGGAGCPPGEGFPALTGPIEGLEASYAAGDTISIRLPLDEDTRYARLAVYDVATSRTLIQNWADPVTPSATATANFSIPASTVPGSYFLTFDLCSTNACWPPFSRTRYERQGTSGEYFETRTTSPTTTTVGPCPSGIPLAVFEIE